MRIVQQSVQFSHSPLLALPAPQIAGLLPARVPSSTSPNPPITISLSRESLHEQKLAWWAAQDAELDAYLRSSHERLDRLFAELRQIAPAELARRFLREVKQ